MLINILLMTLIGTYTYAIKSVKTAIENIYDKIEDSRRIIRDIKLYTEDFHKKTSNLINDICKIKCYIKALIDFQRAIMTIDKDILESLNKNINDKNINDKNINNKNINDKNEKVNKFIQDIEYLKDISNNICLIKDNLLSLNKDNNEDNNNKNINNSKKVNESIPHSDYLKNIANNVSILKDSLLSLGNDIYNYIILPAKERKEIKDFNAKSQGTI